MVYYILQQKHKQWKKKIDKLDHTKIKNFMLQMTVLRKLDDNHRMGENNGKSCLW